MSYILASINVHRFFNKDTLFMIHLWRSIFFWCMATVAFAAPMKTKNVVVVMVDGLRWQEVFRGADPNLLATKPIHPWLGDDKERRKSCLLYTSPSPRDRQKSRMPSSA